MKLYDFPPSGNCYKVRLLMALLGMGDERVESLPGYIALTTD